MAQDEKATEIYQIPQEDGFVEIVEQVRGLVMENMGDKLRLGVFLVEDIASQVADSEIRQFFNHIDNVTDVSEIQTDNGSPVRRFCWVSVKNPFATAAMLKGMEIAGRRLQMRLMGYLYPAQQDG
ncbi:MAG: RNA-binding protein [Thermodesulfobacteriota bacterium]